MGFIVGGVVCGGVGGRGGKASIAAPISVAGGEGTIGCAQLSPHPAGGGGITAPPTKKTLGGRAITQVKNNFITAAPRV